jgi:hypothetical protein
MSNKQASKFEIVYLKDITSNSPIFDRNPFWIQQWTKSNFFIMINKSLNLMNADNVSVYEFRLGDPVVYFFDTKEIKIGFQAIIKLMNL